MVRKVQVNGLIWETNVHFSLVKCHLNGGVPKPGLALVNSISVMCEPIFDCNAWQMFRRIQTMYPERRRNETSDDELV